MRIQVKDFMSSPVTTALKTATVGELRTLMKNNGFHAVPIVEIKNELPQPVENILGIVTMTDVGDLNLDFATAEEVMGSGVHVVHQDSSAKAAASMMLRKKVHHLVVMHEGQIVGMVSSLDFVKLVSEHKLED